MFVLVAAVVVEVAKMTKNWSPGLSPAGVVIAKGIALASAANPTVSIRARNASRDARSISKEGGSRAARTESNRRRIGEILQKETTGGEGLTQHKLAQACGPLNVDHV